MPDKDQPLQKPDTNKDNSSQDNSTASRGSNDENFPSESTGKNDKPGDQTTGTSKDETLKDILRTQKEIDPGNEHTHQPGA